MTNNQCRRWCRTTATHRDGSIVILSENWSLIDLETGLAVAQLYKDTGYQGRPNWRVICRSMTEDGELRDSIMTWYENPTVAREYAEGQTGDLEYLIKRKRTKEQILGRPPKRSSN
jgi:hypothetical protein